MNPDTLVVKITMTREAYARMKTKAAGQPVAPIITGLAMAWLDGTDASPSIPTPSVPTPEEWDALNKWFHSNREVLAAKPDTITTRSGLMAWAQEKGFQKP